MKHLLQQYVLPGLPALLLIMAGVAASVLATGYGIGSFTRMGPGFFPLVLGLGLVLLGLLILVLEFSDTPLSSPAWRPFIAVAASILVWALLVESLGFVLASVCQVLLSAQALPDPKWRSTLALAAILTIAGYLLFVVQLGVPLNAFG